MRRYVAPFLAVIASHCWLPFCMASAQVTEERPDSTRATASHLRSRVRALRKDLLGGGAKLSQAESEATAFYRKKVEECERKLDQLEGEAVSIGAEYRGKLDALLETGNSNEFDSLARDANRKKRDVESLHARIKMTREQRDRTASAVELLARRIERRKDMLKALDSGSNPEEAFFIFNPGMGELFVEDDPSEPETFSQDVLMDLALRDPKRAKPVIARRDPGLYRRLWPLTPPLDLLKKSIPFPSPDPPGER